MKIIVFDTDGLIKLASTGILSKLSSSGLISKEVYQEAVVEGKKRLHQDAFVIEQLVKEGKIEVKEVKSEIIPLLGKGEVSSLALYFKIKAQVIVSDDRQFLTYLERLEIPFLVPSEFLLFLALTKQVKNKECLEALEKNKRFNYSTKLL